MGKFAYVDMYDYDFLFSPYDNSVIDTIEIRFDKDDLGSLASVSTEISGYDDRIYVEGRRFIRTEEKAIERNGSLYLEIKVEELYNDEQRIQQNRAKKNRSKNAIRRARAAHQG